jgi:hypothetical protein
LQSQDLVAHAISRVVLCRQNWVAPDYWIRQPIWSVELGNLDVHTSEPDLVSALRSVTPDKIIFGKFSHSMSETEACTLVEAHLRKYGPLESFETSHGLNATRMKALARFKNAANAQDATSQVSAKNQTMSGRHGNIKLFLCSFSLHYTR